MNYAALCDNECRQFHRLFHNSDWPIDKARAAIYYLVHSSRLSHLKVSLHLLDKYFNRKHHYPVIIFYEELDSYFDIQLVRHFSSSKLFFQKLRFEVPSFLNDSVIPTYGCLGQFSIGYRHMCRFQSRLVYEQPIMSELEYVLRLDDDSMILRQIKYDIFRFVRDRHITYGYVARNHEAACVEGLWPAVDKYISRESIAPQFYYNWSIFEIFYNNFELSSMALWNSDSYRKYIDYIDSLGGIYLNRWGDAPIKTIAVSLFVPLSQTHQFVDIGYKHQGVQT